MPSVIISDEQLDRAVKRLQGTDRERRDIPEPILRDAVLAWLEKIADAVLGHPDWYADSHNSSVASDWDEALEGVTRAAAAKSA